MKRTYCKVTTDEGFLRKLKSLIMYELELKHQQLFQELKKQAIEIIHLDNSDVRSRIIDVGLGVVHTQSEQLKSAKRVASQQRKEAVEAVILNK